MLNDDESAEESLEEGSGQEMLKDRSDSEDNDFYMLNEGRSLEETSTSVDRQSEEIEVCSNNSDKDAYCMNCHKMWMDDDEGLTWIQCGAYDNWIHELCLPIDYIMLQMIFLSSMYMY